MPDISMCDNKSCKRFNECYRAQAIPSKYHQAYTTFGSEGCDGCEDFLIIYRTSGVQKDQNPAETFYDAVETLMKMKDMNKTIDSVKPYKNRKE